MMWRWVATFTLLLHATFSWATQLTPIMESGQLAVLVESTAWPDTLPKDLTSGLTNRILVRVTLARGEQIVQQRAVEIAIRYDLWDEHFEMNVAVDAVEVDSDAFHSRLETSSHTIQSRDDMQAVLRKLHLPRLFSTTELTAAQIYTLRAEVLLNPVDRERMEMIKKWVADNSIAPADIGRGNGGGLAVTIFNRIFEQYAKGADIAAIWHETSTSRPFRLEELSDASR
jgi:hypothetical protein